jgi:hypothetical protein
MPLDENCAKCVVWHETAVDCEAPQAVRRCPVARDQFGGSFRRVRDTAIITPIPRRIRHTMAT